MPSHSNVRRISNRIVVSLAVGIALCSLATPAAAADVTLANDSVGGGGNITLVPGFVAGEMAGATFDPPSAVVQFPVRIKQVQIFWGSLFGGSPDSLERAIHIYNGRPNSPGFSEICFDPTGCALDGPVMVDGFLNGFNLYPAFDVVINQPPFTISLEFENDQSLFSPTVGKDTVGCQPGANWIYCVSGGCSGWTSLCSQTSGNWVFRVVVESLAATGPPTLAGITPDFGNNSQRLTNVRVVGTNFSGAPTLRLNNANTNFQIDATDIDIDTAGALDCTLDLRCVPQGTYHATLTTAGGSSTLNNAFDVSTNMPPTVLGGDITATNSCPGTLTLAVFGQDFLPGATAHLVKGALSVASTNTMYIDGFTLSADFNTALLSQGNWNLKVTNADCQSATSDPINYELVVAGCVPTVTSITPSTANNQQSAFNITNLAGTNLLSGATVRLKKTGQPDIVATNVVSLNNNTRITCRFNLLFVQTGLWNVQVSNPGGGDSNTNVTFNVTLGPPPGVSLVTPANPNNCGNYNATISGSNYFAGAGAKLVLAGQTDITATSVTRNSATSLSATFPLSAAAITSFQTDKWDCVVTNPDGQASTNGTDKVNVVCCPTYIKGDMDGNGTRDARDVQIFVRTLITQGGSGADKCRADLAAPAGVINNADATAFIQCLLGGSCP